MENNEPTIGPVSNAETEDKTWIKPEIVSFKPVEAAEGISYRPLDGISNLTV